MNYIFSFFQGIILKENTEGFKEKRFMHNNACILLLAFYLTLEQLYYGFITFEPDKLIHYIHFSASFVMILYILLSGYLQIRKVENLYWFHKIYEVSFGFFGFIVAMAKALLIQENTFALPSIYIAVVYGFAVFFYFSPIISFCIYGITCTVMIILLPEFNPAVIQITYMQDIVSNNVIAWIASIINYHRFVNEYKSQRIICNKNEFLQAKTTKIEKKNKILQYISNVDALTNIYNRRKLNELLEIEYNKCKTHNRNISLILMDVDLFKSINDTYGHNAGDKVLAKLGEILKNNIRKSDKAGRWGGEEFIIICSETNFEDAYNLAEQIRKIIENYDFKLGKKVTCSFGVSTNKEKDSIANLVFRADKGLYKAKKAGRNRVEVSEQ